MSTTQLKRNFHNLIDEIENEVLLMRFYELMQVKNASKDGQYWSKLTNEEQLELLLTNEEMKKTSNHISHEEMKNKHKKWL